MWYEILPSAAIIAVVMAVPSYGLYGLRKLTLGNVRILCIFTNLNLHNDDTTIDIVRD